MRRLALKSSHAGMPADRSFRASSFPRAASRPARPRG